MASVRANQKGLIWVGGDRLGGVEGHFQWARVSLFFFICGRSSWGVYGELVYKPDKSRNYGVGWFLGGALF